MEVEINEQSVKLRFSYSLLRALGERWEFSDLGKIFSKIFKAFSEVEKDSFSAIDISAEILCEAAKLEGNEIEVEHAADYLFLNPEIIGLMVGEFIKSMPKPKEPVKKKPVKKM